MIAKIYTIDGAQSGTTELPASVFGVEVKTALLHSVIVGYLAAQRQGTAKTKGRSEVSGGGKKPWKQKGTGRARSGSNTSPIWARGGKAHGAKPRDYRMGITKKMRQGALLSAYSQRASEENITILDVASFDAPKTSIMASFLTKIAFAEAKTLIVLPEDQQNIYLSSRNIKDVNVKVWSDVCAYDVMNAKNIVIVTKEVIAKIEGTVIN